MSISIGYAPTADGDRVYYATESGDGTPVVIADAPWRWPVDAALVSPTDLAFIRAFARGRPWYTLDYRGRGRSSAPAGPLTLDGFVEDLAAIARVAGGPFDVWANVHGCPIALAFAARHPESVARLVLKEPLRRECDRVISPGWNRIFGGGDPEALAVLFKSWGDDDIEDDLALEIGRLWAPTATRAFLGAIRHAVWAVDLVELGRQVSCPVLLCDRQAQIEPVLAMAADWPGVRVAVETVQRGGQGMGRDYAEMLERNFPQRRRSAGGDDAGVESPLSPRELEVLTLVADGASNAKIAEALVISPHTAERHVASILAKLDLHSRAQAAAYAHRHGLAPAPPKAGAER